MYKIINKFTLAGFVMLLASGLSYQSTSTFLSGAVSAEGSIVDYIRTSESVLRQPMIRFTTRNGKEVKFVKPFGISYSGTERLERVPVIYNPTVPKEAKINDWFSVWGKTVLLAGLGAVMFMAGIGIVVFNRKEAGGHVENSAEENVALFKETPKVDKVVGGG